VFKTWPFTLREKHRLRVFENRVLKRIIGSIRYEIIGEWMKLHSEYLYGLYCSPSIVRVMELRRMIPKGQTACTVGGKGEVHTGF
jgi:hypothetical protein